jgi:hypothetical protein
VRDRPAEAPDEDDPPDACAPGDIEDSRRERRPSQVGFFPDEEEQVSCRVRVEGVLGS